MLSSLPLQILFFFNGWYDVAFTIAMSSLYAWKGSTLPYPDELRPMLGLEVAIVFLLAIIEYARIFLGTKGNKTEQSGPLLMSLVLNGISMAFVGLELLLSLLTIITFVKAPAAQSDS